MGIWPFRRSRADSDAERLLAAVIQVSRQPAFFGEGRAPDTLDGRLELMTLHAVLALRRLQAEPGLSPLAQAFTDQLFRHFDAGLREAGVGDLSVPKRMRRIAGDFYGRRQSYSEALDAGDAMALSDALVRNIGLPEGFAPTLAAYALACALKQQMAASEELMRLDGWPLAPG